MDKEGFIAQLENKERVLVARVLDQAEQAIKKTAPVTTDFLDPSEKALCCEVLHFLPEVKTLFFGGYRKAERQRIVLVPAFYLTETVASPLAYLAIKPATKTGIMALSGAEEPCFTHRDVLGAILGLALKREKIGDLLLTKDEAQAIVAEEIAEFLLTNLRKVGTHNVKVEAIDPEQLNTPVEKVKEIKSTVASLRLDAVAGIGYGVSRSRMAREIKMAKVKVNWRPVTAPDYKVDVGDVLSIRGRGRVVVAELGGETKKGRLVVKLNRLQ
jgi:RNA-binding protein YlmH